MSVSIQTVEFEQREAYLSSQLDEGPPYTVHGVALGADDVTVGQSGIKKLWPADELEKAAESLEGRSLVVDHNNGSDGVVGQVTKAGYKEKTGVIYEAELFDDNLAEKINNGLLEVSIRGKHSDVEQMEETDDGAKVVEDITFDNLSIVPTGAAPSNTIEVGEADELSMAELSSFTDDLARTQLAEVEPGMWVKWGDNRGITISQVEDGSIEVDIYEEQDGQWRSTEETTEVSADDLSEWDVDEEDIGPVEDEETGDDEDESSKYGDMDEDDEEASAFNYTDEMAVSGVPDNLLFSSEEDAMEFIEGEEGLTGVHQMDGEWVPGADHKEFIAWMRAQEEADVSDDPMESNDVLAAQGDKVKWEASGGQAQGVVVDRKTDGCFSERIDGDQEICADDDDPVVLIEIVKDGERTGTMVAHKESTLSSADFELSKYKMDPEPPEFDEGMMVQWQVNPDMFGEVVHNPDDEDIVMVEVMQMMDGEMKPTGHTLTAAPPDLMPMDEEQMTATDELETFSDYPDAASENAQMALDAREETDNPNDCGTEVGWRRANQLASGEAVSEDVVAKMSSFNRHRQNSEMDDDEGKADCGWMMWKAWGGDEGVDWAMNKMDNMEEASRIEGEEKPITSDDDKKENRKQSPERFIDEEELQNIEVHSVDFSGTTDSSWDKPAMEDFETSDLGQIADHFLVSKTEFPPDNFTDLALPVVGPNGDLNLNALQNAKARASQVEGLSGDALDRVVTKINNLANDNFDADFGDEEEARREQDERDRMPRGEASSVNVLTGDDLRHTSGKSEESELDDITTKVNNMTDDIEQKLAELSEPVAVEQDDLDELQQKADRFEEMSDTLESLKERTDVLDDVDRNQVDELAEADEPVVVESARMESLEAEAEQVAETYASELAAESFLSAEELTDKFSIEELREKYEEQIGDPAEELATSEDSEPQSGDVEEEELEERADEGTEDEEELSSESDEAEEMRDELRNKILG